MNFRSYLGKVFVVENSKAVLRDDDLSALKYQPGDSLPPGKNIGDVKTIPQRTEIIVTDVKTDSGRHTYVFARPAHDAAGAFGWTSAANLVGGFANETAGLAPSKWALEPQGNNKTCVDANALIREGPPGFVSKGTAIPQKSFVVVTDSSGDNVKVSKLEIVDGKMVTGEELGWTRLSNLRDGCSDVYFSAEWADQKGPNACWEHGNFIGAKLLVNIVGFGAELEQVTLDSLDAYLKLKDAAADGDNIGISINSAFRTFQRQAELFHLFEIHQGNKAARPGASNHQHGQAFDLNTGHNVFNGTDKVYEWLKKNAPQHGFVRAVSNESWHWEYRPDEAARLAAGEFMLPGIHDA
jgi:hypothetical protein